MLIAGDRHKVLVSVRGLIEVDLAVATVDQGRLDNAIMCARAQFERYVATGSSLYMGIPAEALVELLIKRGGPDDLVEIRAVLTEWEAGQFPAPIPGLDLWRLKCRVMVTKAEGNDAAYTEVTKQYQELAERLGARVEII